MTTTMTIISVHLERYDHNKPYRNRSYRYRAKYNVCRQCRFFDRCVSSKTNGRQVVRNIDDKYIEWADRCLNKHERRRLLGRRKYRAEGSFADASNNHGYKRARWRGMAKMQVQNLMIAAVQNIRKLLVCFSDGGRAEAVYKALSADFSLIPIRFYMSAGWP